ncbi:acyl-CoA dehydrogenase-related protein [Dorcoceras hygrometricum]|uniref:Acyl-CoA dehydrogenase-related protein n=1 Tax=Dorcoceras hygrometricum TaxID=472368 RepID=A0A2Z7BKK9_9LAMI|nr:acyl-CoA dehydrogenase-related protein [Dorcoceras hygrometricum]
MSLFDLQDVCIAIGSLATLDLPMVVDLIGIYGLKGPYCTLTMTDWFMQALSVIPRGSWGDVARSFTMIRWARFLLTKVKRRRLTTSSWSLKPTADHSTESNPSQRQWLISSRTSAVNSAVDPHLTTARTRVNANCCFPLHTHC